MRYFFAIISIFLISCNNEQSREALSLPGPGTLYKQAIQESLVPVHPGIPGKTPFWNRYAQRFIYAPAFEFQEVPGADEYLFTAETDSGSSKFTFTTKQPTESIAPIWDKLPVSHVILKVEGLKNGSVAGMAGQRDLYKASPYHGPYHKPDISFHFSLVRFVNYLYNAPYIQYWVKYKKPDPDYGLYCYPSKMIPAVINGMLLFSEMTGCQDQRDIALQIAEISADYLIGQSQPAGAPMEFFPPTYTGPIYADMIKEYRGPSLADRIMMIYPAVAGNAYLNLYDKTGKQKYFEAAKHIADTYKTLQLDKGSWHLLTYIKSGEPVAGNFVVPTGVMEFLNRFGNHYHLDDYKNCSERAEEFIRSNIADSYNWEGQFEDQKPSERYKNLSKGQACAYATFLLNNYSESPDTVNQALDLIRFSEDQFVIWDKSNPIENWGINSANWITPCVLEQYNFYTPVNASSADMIKACLQAYKQTGNKLFLAKAISLANTIVYTQNKDTGHYPTYLVDNLLDQEGWINCMVFTAEAVKELDDFLRENNFSL